MYENDYDFERDLSESLFSDEYEIPDAPESWELDDFDDLVCSAEEF